MGVCFRSVIHEMISKRIRRKKGNKIPCDRKDYKKQQRKQQSGQEGRKGAGSEVPIKISYV